MPGAWLCIESELQAYALLLQPLQLVCPLQEGQLPFLAAAQAAAWGQPMQCTPFFFDLMMYRATSPTITSTAAIIIRLVTKIHSLI